MEQYERRASAIKPSLVDGGTIRGTAIVFNSRSVDLGGFVEYIRPQAVDRALEADVDIRALYQHDDARVLGRTTNRTLRFVKTATGLEVEIVPPDTPDGQTALALLRRGDLDGMSFGFRVRPGGDRWYREDGQDVREVTDMDIREVSIVTWPAYPETSAAVRGALEAFRRHGADRPGRSVALASRAQRLRVLG